MSRTHDDNSDGNEDRRRRVTGFGSTLWMGLGWVILILALVFPFPWWW
jgi:hypothetical protein